MTAEEFKNKNALLFLSNPEKIMVEFAQYHVKQALEAAAKNAKLESYDYVGAPIDENSILNAYPESNIV